MDVKPLPAGAPDSFQGAVGQFEIASAVSTDKADIQVGDAVTQRIAIRGQGNLETLADPTWPAAAEWRAFDSKTETDAKFADGKFAGTRTYERVLVPTQAGQLTLPAVEFSYFDPAQGTYQTVSGEASQVNVAPDAAAAAAAPSTADCGGRQSFRSCLQRAGYPAAQAGPGQMEQSGSVAATAARILAALGCAAGSYCRPDPMAATFAVRCRSMPAHCAARKPPNRRIRLSSRPASIRLMLCRGRTHPDRVHRRQVEPLGDRADPAGCRRCAAGGRRRCNRGQPCAVDPDAERDGSLCPRGLIACKRRRVGADRAGHRRVGFGPVTS